jgi:hypothetical protein
MKSIKVPKNPIWEDLEHETERMLQFIERFREIISNQKNMSPKMKRAYEEDLLNAYKHAIDMTYLIRREKHA